jgi:hypothetical protein
MKNLNQKLKEGDRVYLLHMEGEDLYDIEGIVTGTKVVPREKGSESGFMYTINWFDEDENLISDLPMSPDVDKWVKID